MHESRADIADIFLVRWYDVPHLHTGILVCSILRGSRFVDLPEGGFRRTGKQPHYVHVTARVI